MNHQSAGTFLLLTQNNSCSDVVNKKSVLENLDLVLITIDETLDQGCASQLTVYSYTV
jgi:hypothetical protein